MLRRAHNLTIPEQLPRLHGRRGQGRLLPGVVCKWRLRPDTVIPVVCRSFVGPIVTGSRHDGRIYAMPLADSVPGVLVLLVGALGIASGVRIVIDSRSTDGKRRTHEFDHRIPGVAIMIGVLAVLAGSVLPWLEAKGPKTIYILETQPQQNISGFDEGAEEVLVTILVAAGFALLVAVALMATHRARGLVWRLLALLCGLTASAIGAIFVAAPEQNDDAVIGFLSSAGLVSVKPGLGAYLLLLGGVVVAFGAIMPGHRKLIVARGLWDQ